MNKTFTTKKLAICGVLTAIMIISIFFKTVSVYISGPIVNTVLLIVTLTLGPVFGIILCIIAPIASLIIAAPAPVLACPWLMIPAIAMGNIIICLTTSIIYRNIKKFWSLPVGLILGSLAKAGFMGAVISNYIIPVFCKSLPEKVIPVAQTTFSVTQLITALIASAVVYLVWSACGKYLTKEAND